MNQETGFWEGVFANMYASLGCGALSAKCTAVSNTLQYFWFSRAGRRILQKPPLLNPPFLGS